jgi:hypothetical protein
MDCRTHQKEDQLHSHEPCQGISSACLLVLCESCIASLIGKTTQDQADPLGYPANTSAQTQREEHNDLDTKYEEKYEVAVGSLL